MLKTVQSILKHKGLSKKTVSKCTEELTQMSNSNGPSHEFGNQLKELLEESVADYTDSEVSLGSSDVLESLFGKFKNQIIRTALGSNLLIPRKFECPLMVLSVGMEDHF